MPRIGFNSDGTTPYVYIETQSGGGPTICSTAIGMDSTIAGVNTFKICTAPLANVTAESTPNISIDPRTNGNITFAPNGSGSIALNDTNHITPTGGVLQAAATTGDLTASKGTDGQLLIGSSIGAPTWAGITAGSGISVTPGHNTITIAASGGSGVTSVSGNSGTSITGAIAVDAANCLPTFVSAGGAGGVVTIDFQATTNIALGSNMSALAGGIHNVGIGENVFSAVTSGSNNSAHGFIAGESITTGAGNTCMGDAAISNLVTGSYNIAVGYQVGSNYATSESSNILLNSAGVASESNVLRIGSATGSGNTQLAAAYISGIDGVNVGSTAKIVTLGTGGTVNKLGTATLTAGSNVTITPGANTITIAASGGGGFAWNDVTAGTQAMAPGNGYITDFATQVVYTLPAVAAQGTILEVAGGAVGALGWQIAQNAGQSIAFGSSTTTVGGGGSLTSTNQWDAVRLLCVVANLKWTVLSVQGNLTVV
jgi:hypothetical protein